MHGREFFDVAVQLSNGKSAAELRSCVSRAYYAAFHAAREFVDIECRVNLPADAACHKKLHELLESSGNALLIGVGRQLSSLREARNNADYQLGHAPSSSRKYAIMYLTVSRNIIAVLENGINPDSRADAVDGIRNKATSVFRLILRA